MTAFIFHEPTIDESDSLSLWGVSLPGDCPFCQGFSQSRRGTPPSPYAIAKRMLSRMTICFSVKIALACALLMAIFCPARARGGSVELSWNPSASPRAVGYSVHQA